MAEKSKSTSTPSGDIDTSEWDQGYRGITPDPTPNEAYTLAGVTGGEETPETKEPGSEGASKRSPDALVAGTTAQAIPLTGESSKPSKSSGKSE